MLGKLPGFTVEDIVNETDFFVIWRKKNVVGMQIVGPLDDNRTRGWRSALETECVRQPIPRFLVMDVEDIDPVNSMAERFRTVTFAQRMMGQADFAVVHIGQKPAPRVVVRAMMRMLGISKLFLCEDRTQFVSMASEMHADRCPSL